MIFQKASLIFAIVITIVNAQRRISRTGGQRVERQSSCSDVPGWYDDHGGCSFYGGESQCVSHGDDGGSLGLSANKACCSCGGGLPDDPVFTATGWQFVSQFDHWLWAIKGIELYASGDCHASSLIEIPEDATYIDSGRRTGTFPEGPFASRPKPWGGLKGDDNDFFYIGIELPSQQTVRCIKIKQGGKDTPGMMVMSRETPNSEWKNVFHATDIAGKNQWTTISMDSEVDRAAPPANLIEVPAHLVPNKPGVHRETQEILCEDVNLGSVEVPPNPGYPNESNGAESLSGNDMWATTFYMMLYANCERQARNIAPFRLWSFDIMLQLQPTYALRSGHEGFGARAKITRGVVAEGSGGAPLVGSENKSEDDFFPNGVWDPIESARRTFTGLVFHGGAMRDPQKTCVWAGATVGPNPQDNRMATTFFYGSTCETYDGWD